MQAARILSFILCSSVALLAQADQAAVKAPSSLSISGTVLRADTRAPLPHVQINLNGGGIVDGDGTKVVFQSGQEDASDAVPKPAVITDDKGHFTIANLKPGVYMLSASRTGMVQKNGNEFGTVVRLQAPNSQNITILMLVSGAISGRVLNEDGEPMQNVSMGAMRFIYTLGSRHLFPEANATTDDKGEYRLFGLKPGSYYVMAEAGKEGLESADTNASQVAAQAQKKPDVTVYAARFFPNETSPDRATPVVVKPGDEASADFSLSRVPAHKISGKVSGLSASPINDSDRHIRYVMAMQRGMELQSSMGSLRADGTFEIPALTPGSYKLIAIDTDMKGSANYGFRNVLVDSSDVTGVSIALNPAKGQIKGVIRPDSDAKLDLSKL
jgi:Carboxypeptidase regulatory-like domain